MKVSPETRKIIKKQVISLIKKGKKQSEIAETVGISPQAKKEFPVRTRRRVLHALRKKAWT